jgi:nucleotide-binding universal stress UspA family protein
MPENASPTSTTDHPRRPRIVVGIDGSAFGKKALEWAAREARLHDAELVVVYAWQIPSLGLPGVAPPYPKDEFVAYGQRIADESIVEVPDAAGATVEIVEGHPREVLVEFSREADLLVVGSHGHGKIPGTLLGSVSHGVAMHAACPVVIIRLRSE